MNRHLPGPAAPGEFWLGGKRYTGLSLPQSRLLEVVWSRRRVEIGDVLAAVYGHDAEQTEDALKSLSKRLNGLLSGQECLAQVRQRDGYMPDVRRCRPKFGVDSR